MARFSLGVYKRCSSNAIRGELGMFPSGFLILDKSMRYLERLQTQNPESLLGDAFSMCIEPSRFAYHWKSSSLRLFNVCGFIHNDLSVHNPQWRASLNILKEKFIVHWKNNISTMEDNKLRTYSKFKSNFQKEGYLNDVPIGNHRKALTRIRTGSHYLHIKTGRYNKPEKTPSSKWFCRICNIALARPYGYTRQNPGR